MNPTSSKLRDYIRAFQPIIYIPAQEFSEADEIIEEAAKDYDLSEFSDYGGRFSHSTKRHEECDALTFLSYFDESENKSSVIVLKDFHLHFNDIKILSALKTIAHKTTTISEYNVTVIIVASRMVIPPELEKFITVLEIPYPGIDDIKDIILEYDNIDNAKHLHKLANSLKGMSKYEIKQLLHLFYHDTGNLENADYEIIQTKKEQAIKKSNLLELIEVDEKIEYVGGHKSLKDFLKRKANVFKRIDDARNFGLTLPKGILIAGKTGCGKSLMAKACAKLFDLPLLKLDLGKMLGKYVGESEQNFRQTFKIAEAVSPCILWIDEVEKAFAGLNNNNDGGVTTRLFGQFLTWMQENEKGIFIIATSNKIDSLPPEFYRKGRFDELFYTDLPDTKEREEIFLVHLNKIRTSLCKIGSIDISKLAKKTDKYSGAEIESIVKEALENVFLENKRNLTTEDLLSVIQSSKISEKSGTKEPNFKKLGFKSTRYKAKTYNELDNLI